MAQASTSPLERRVPLAHLPTPIEPMDRLAAHLGLPEATLWAKRDDCTGLAGGGNKARKLEYLCADAIARGCDTLVTGGGCQSNHVRMTAAAANRLGMACTIVISAPEPDLPTGNVVLDHLLAPEIVWAPRRLEYYETEAAIDETCERLRVEGRRPYAMPIGGASTLGCLGYVAGGREVLAQCDERGAAIDVVVVADGSGGTHAGLMAGLGERADVLGVDVGARPDLDEMVPAKAAAAAALAGLAPPGRACTVDHDRFGRGYGAATDDGRAAVDLAARLEGLVLDPVYTGKAMAGLVAAVAEGRIAPGTGVVFVHTGGMPTLFDARYADWVTSRPSADEQVVGDRAPELG